MDGIESLMLKNLQSFEYGHKKHQQKIECF